MDEGVESETITPAGGEVTNIDVGVACGLHLAPEQQCILRRFGLAAVSFLDSDVLDLHKNKSKGVKKTIKYLFNLQKASRQFHVCFRNASFIQILNTFHSHNLRQMSQFWRNPIFQMSKIYYV